MKAVILAAGRGSRLYPYTKYIPKCLLDIEGETILERQINHIRDCGIYEIVIVVGFGFEKVENLLRNYNGLGIQIKTLYNPFYQTTNSLISLWIARGEMNEDIAVIDGDNLFEIEVLKRILRVRNEKISLCVKRKPIYQKEDTNVLIIGGRVVGIGKNLTIPSAKSVGISVLRNTGVELLKGAVEEEIRTVGVEKRHYISAIQRLISKGHSVKSIDIGELFWMDVDCPSDLLKARFNSAEFIKRPPAEKTLRVVETSS